MFIKSRSRQIDFGSLGEMMLRKSLIALLLILAGAFLGSGCQERNRPEAIQHEAATSVYHCPMHPQIIKGSPGLCPICGMDLVRIESESPSDNPSTSGYPAVRLSIEMIKTLKIRTEKVVLRDSSGIFIPARALVRTENRPRVMVALGGGRFQPRSVEIMEESRDSVGIVQGVEEGEEIVVSGQFLLDSESSLRAAASETKRK